MIPIVYGAPNLHEYIPKGTYINVMDYISPNELAKDLMRIGSNKTIYTQFLKEKDKYTAERISGKTCFVQCVLNCTRRIVLRLYQT